MLILGKVNPEKAEPKTSPGPRGSANGVAPEPLEMEGDVRQPPSPADPQDVPERGPTLPELQATPPYPGSERQWMDRMEDAIQQRRAAGPRQCEHQPPPPPRGQEPEAPRPKLPIFDGKEEWEGFVWSFGRMVAQSQWTPQQKLSRLHESLRGSAASFASNLPGQVQNDYDQLMRELDRQFGRRDCQEEARRSPSGERFHHGICGTGPPIGSTGLPRHEHGGSGGVCS